MTESSVHLTMEKLDSEDVRAVVAGNAHAFTGIVERHTVQIYGLAVRSLGNPHDAEEAVQDVFLKAFRSLGHFDSDRRFFPWLYSIALNHLRSLKRRSGRRHARAIQLVEELVPNAPQDGSDPENSLLARAARDVVGLALMDLKPIHREVFVLRHLRGLSTSDAAKVMGIPENTLKTNLSRARKHLQKILATRGYTGTPG